MLSESVSLSIWLSFLGTELCVLRLELVTPPPPPNPPVVCDERDFLVFFIGWTAIATFPPVLNLLGGFIVRLDCEKDFAEIEVVSCVVLDLLLVVPVNDVLEYFLCDFDDLLVSLVKISVV